MNDDIVCYMDKDERDNYLKRLNGRNEDSPAIEYEQSDESEKPQVPDVFEKAKRANFSLNSVLKFANKTNKKKFEEEAIIFANKVLIQELDKIYLQR
jgi:hypothetical protein